MNSLDTNILIYATDIDCCEHTEAKLIVEQMLEHPEAWVIADQVLFEFYKALRNPRIFKFPRDAPQAAAHIHFLQSETGIARCCYDLSDWESVFFHLAAQDTPAGRIHDIVLGSTLKSHGVECFYTRNTKDFMAMGFPQLINPISNP